MRRQGGDCRRRRPRAGRRRTWANWEERSRSLLAEFRAAADQHAGEPTFAELIGVLEQTSSEFRAWWASYEVRQTIDGPLKISTTEVGVISLDVIELQICTHPSLRLSIHAPTRPADERKLNRLATLPATSPRRWGQKLPAATSRSAASYSRG